METPILGGYISAPGDLTGNDNFNLLWGGVFWHTTEGERLQIMPASGKLKLLRGKLANAPGVGHTYTLTIRTGATVGAMADSPLTVTIDNTAPYEVSDVTNEVAITAGTLVSIKVVTTNGATGRGVYWHLVFEGDNEGEGIFMGGTWDSPDAAATEYLPLTGGTTYSPIPEDRRQVFPTPGTLKYLYVYVRGDPGVAPNSWTFTVLIDGVSTGITAAVTRANFAAVVSDITHSAAISEGEEANISCVPNDAPWNPLSLAWGVRWVPDTDGEAVIHAGDPANDIHTSTTEYADPATPYGGWNSGSGNRFCLAGNWTFRKMYVKLENDPDNGAGEQGFIFMLRKEFADTGQWLDIDDGHTTGSDVTDVWFDAHDRVTIECTPYTTDVGTPTVGWAHIGLVLFRGPKKFTISEALTHGEPTFALAPGWIKYLQDNFGYAADNTLVHAFMTEIDLRYFEEDFEENNLNKWDGIEAVRAAAPTTTNLNDPYEGTFHMECVTNGDGIGDWEYTEVYKDFDFLGRKKQWFKYYAKTNRLPANGEFIYIGDLWDADYTGWIAGAGITYDGVDYKWVLEDGVGIITTIADAQLAVDTYYELELGWIYNGSGDIDVYLKIDGGRISLSGNRAGAHNDFGMGRFYLGAVCSEVAQSYRINIDKVRIGYNRSIDLFPPRALPVEGIDVYEVIDYTKLIAKSLADNFSLYDLYLKQSIWRKYLQDNFDLAMENSELHPYISYIRQDFVQDDFETADLRKWTSSSASAGCSIGTSDGGGLGIDPYEGSQLLKGTLDGDLLNDSALVIRRINMHGITSYWYKFKVGFEKMPAAWGDGIIFSTFADPDGNWLVELYIYQTATGTRWEVKDAFANADFTGDDSELGVNIWYDIDIKLDIDPSDGSYSLRVIIDEGRLELNVAPGAGAADKGIRGVRLHARAKANALATDVYWDNFRMGYNREIDLRPPRALPIEGVGYAETTPPVVSIFKTRTASDYLSFYDKTGDMKKIVNWWAEDNLEGSESVDINKLLNRAILTDGLEYYDSLGLQRFLIREPSDAFEYYDVTTLKKFGIFYKSLADALEHYDTISLKEFNIFYKTLAEAMEIYEAPNVKRVLARLLTDYLEHRDDLYRQAFLRKYLQDSLEHYDDIGVAITRPILFTDAFEYYDDISFQKILKKYISDALEHYDTLSLIQASIKYKSFTDAFEHQDTFTTQKTLSRLFTDYLEFRETFYRQGYWNRYFQDNLDFHEDRELVQAFSLSLADAMEHYDVVYRQHYFRKYLQDSFEHYDSLALQGEIFQRLKDSFEIFDQLYKQGYWSRYLEDRFTLNDEITSKQFFSLVLSEAFEHYDELTRQAFLRKYLEDNLEHYDLSSLYQGHTRELNDYLAFSDEFYRQSFLRKYLQDSLEHYDVITPAVTKPVLFTDAFEHYDAIYRQSELRKYFSDPFYLGEYHPVNSLYLDDETNWSVTTWVPLGGAISSPQITEEKTIVKEGDSSLKTWAAAAGTARHLVPYLAFAQEDWTHYTHLSFWWYGSNTGRTLGVYVYGPDTSNHIRLDLHSDNFNGWKYFEWNLRDEFIATGGTFDRTRVMRVAFAITGVQPNETWYIDWVRVFSKAPYMQKNMRRYYADNLEHHDALEVKRFLTRVLVDNLEHYDTLISQKELRKYLQDNLEFYDDESLRRIMNRILDDDDFTFYDSLEVKRLLTRSLTDNLELYETLLSQKDLRRYLQDSLEFYDAIDVKAIIAQVLADNFTLRDDLGRQSLLRKYLQDNLEHYDDIALQTTLWETFSDAFEHYDVIYRQSELRKYLADDVNFHDDLSRQTSLRKLLEDDFTLHDALSSIAAGIRYRSLQDNFEYYDSPSFLKYFRKYIQDNLQLYDVLLKQSSLRKYLQDNFQLREDLSSYVARTIVLEDHFEYHDALSRQAYWNRYFQDNVKYYSALVSAGESILIFSDNLTLHDSLYKQAQYRKYLQDHLEVYESLSSFMDYRRFFQEHLDYYARISVGVIQPIIISEALSIADDIRRGMGTRLELEDDLTLSDDFTSYMERFLDFFDNFDLYSATEVQRIITKALMDAYEIYDALLQQKARSKTLQDNITIRDTLTQQYEAFLDIVDRLTHADTILRGVVKATTFADRYEHADRMSRVVGRTVSIAEATYIRDVIELARARNRDLQDNFTLADSLLTQKFLRRYLKDNYDYYSNITLFEISGLTLRLSDYFNYYDVLYKQSHLRRTIQDNLTISDLLTPKAISNIYLADYLTLRDVLSKTQYQEKILSLMDNLEFSDSLYRSRQINKALVEAYNLADQLTYVPLPTILNVYLSDVFSIYDVLTRDIITELLYHDIASYLTYLATSLGVDSDIGTEDTVPTKGDDVAEEETFNDTGKRPDKDVATDG